MFFPMRCAIWLTVVYVMIFTQDPAERREAPVMQFSQTMQSVIARAVGRVETGVTEYCAKQPSECLRVAGKLASVTQEPRAQEQRAQEPRVQEQRSQEQRVQEQRFQEQRVVETSVVPLPPPRPARQILSEHAAEKAAHPQEARARAMRPSKS